MTAGLYEQIKADLGYLNMDTAAGSFATLAEQARTGDWSHIEFLARLVAEQATADRDRRLTARLRYAGFPYRRRVEDFDFEFQPSVDRKLVEDLATLRFIDENRPVLFLGQPGCGKTHLAVARHDRDRGRLPRLLHHRRRVLAVRVRVPQSLPVVLAVMAMTIGAFAMASSAATTSECPTTTAPEGVSWFV